MSNQVLIKYPVTFHTNYRPLTLILFILTFAYPFDITISSSRYVISINHFIKVDFLIAFENSYFISVLINIYIMFFLKCNIIFLLNISNLVIRYLLHML